MAPTCLFCGEPLPPRGRRGPARVYCSGRCREAARRRRRADTLLRAELEPAGASVPIAPPLTAHPDDQVVVAVLEADRLVGAFLRLGRDARPAFSWRCTKVGEALRAALSASFGDLE